MRTGMAQRKQRTRAALLAAAAELFGRHGYEATTMQEIASRAQVGLGTVYGYFPSKELVLRTVLEEHRLQAVRRSTEALRETRGAVERACLILRHLWEFLDEHRPLSLALISLEAARSRGSTRGDGNEATFTALFIQLERGQARGEIAPIPLETTIKALLSSYTWAALRLGMWRDRSDTDRVLEDLEALSRRLLTPGGS